MIISFRGKTTTDWPDQTDTNKKEGATPDPSIREGNKKEDFPKGSPLFRMISDVWHVVISFLVFTFSLLVSTAAFVLALALLVSTAVL